MTNKEFKAQAVNGQSYWSWIEIAIDDRDNDTVYHRYAYQSDIENKNKYGKVCKSIIRYAKPSWSSELAPYFIRHGIREYLSNYIVNR